MKVGQMDFSAREDYLEYCGVPFTEPKLNLCPQLITSIQRNWHSKGQNGCLFAMHAAVHFDQVQWSSTIYNDLPEYQLIRTALENATRNPNNELHSLIFPNIVDIEQMSDLISRLMDAGFIMRKKIYNNECLIRLRWLLPGKVESWVVGFSSIKNLPITRQAPFSELVIRTKTKTKIIHTALNNEVSQAHVADLDLGLSTAAVGRWINRSIKRTSTLLGGEEARKLNSSAKAKTTYGFKYNNNEGLK